MLNGLSPLFVPRSCRQPRTHGLSLIEACVALALVALMVCLAWPSWSQASRKTRRAEAISALLGLQQAQEQRYAAQGAYTDDLAALGWPTGLSTSGLYRLQIIGASAAGYTATATLLPSSDASNDAECQVLAVRWTWGQSSFGSACAGCSLPGSSMSSSMGSSTGSSTGSVAGAVDLPILSDPARCWSR